MSFSAAELVERRGFLGASEAAAAVGRCNFFTPLELYKDKIGEGESIEETIPMMVGTALENVVLRLLEKQEGITVGSRQLRVVDPAHPWRRCTLDGRAEDGWNVQAKTSGMYAWWGKEEDDIPEGIIHQVMHEMACNGAPGAWVPVIIGQRTFRVYRIKRDEEHIEMLTAGEVDFMTRVQDRNPPPPINLDDLKLMYPIDTGIELVATADIESLAYELAATKAQLKVLEKQEEIQKFGIVEFMKDAALLKTALGTPLYTYKHQVRNSIDVTRLRKEKPAIAAEYNRETDVRVLLNKIK